MAEENEHQGPPAPPEQETSIEKLLREREKLDAQLKEQFAQNITVMFTDIKGSTNFFETYGDIEGRLMVQKHNEMLFPLVEQHRGRVIKTIGDAIMAAFDDSAEAVRSAIAMQESLHAYNKTKKDRRDEIHIRIGINTGEGLVEKSDIFGDVVNVAARVESLTQPDEIMVSQPVYNAVRKTDDILCRYAMQTKVKGKEAPIDVYRVVWGEEDAMTGLTRSASSAARVARRHKALKRRLELDISREDQVLKITVAEKSETAQSTIRPYEEMSIAITTVEERCREITDLLNRANTRGQVSKDILAKLRDVGGVLFDSLLTPKAKETLRGSSIQDLVFHIEDTLVQIPWELLYDGEQFLCQKFNMGRIVKTRHSIVNIKQRVLSRPLKMLIVSDPRGDLENSSREGRAIRDLLDSNPAFISANQRSGQVSPSYMAEKIRNFDMLHYAGHADYDTSDPANSGLLLDGGKFTSADIMKLVGGRPLPALVFSNACQSGQTEEWSVGASYNQKIFGLANAFLLAGVQHYVGTFWEILDEPGAHFAAEFYRVLMDGASIGEAIREARMLLIKQYGEDTIVWASYMLYGDPGFNYFDFAGEAAEEDEASAAQNLGETAQLRSAPAETVSFQAPAAQRPVNKMLVLGATLAVVLLAAVLFFVNRPGKGRQGDPYLLAYSQLRDSHIPAARTGFEGLPDDDPRHYEGLAAVFFELGDYDNALQMSEKALMLAPYNLYAHVIKGNILFARGNLDEALTHFQKAADKEGGISWQKAAAFNGLARISSSRGNSREAVELYGRAAPLDPENAVIQTNYAVAMQKSGNAAGALGSFQKAAAANPGDSFAPVLLAAAKQAADENRERQQRIDTLVNELAASFKAGRGPSPPADPWTSRPVAISFLNITSRGNPATREGADDFFVLQLSSLLQESGRIQIVERELLDKLLAELKLSSTELVNPATAVRLGKILSARVVATGSIMRYKDDIQVSIRLTDTETTTLKGAVIVSGSDLAALAQKAAEKITAKITAGYPLRGKILSLAAGQLVLNIGTEAGVQGGMAFNVMDELPIGDTGRVRLIPAGTIRVASAAAQESFAEAESAKDLKAGLKVEQIVQ